ncbi:predicted protein [Uncinocarpus reesii 1704]|uniref:Uncharacterized protein n=1 Tax=Uncinocarpus reesii (strain UAMH 1704) TaxID=336963 RepID=C4JFR2_UNCRE|nr:uncharacterized protein UREG_02396 [Uncinocarpus reesii 1704]EEP77547.1 predicted protein [Uncinocarpus reesii 1704]
MGKSSGGDLSDFAIRGVYGELMGEMRILNPMETVMLEFVCCLADDVAPQAKGWVFSLPLVSCIGLCLDAESFLRRHFFGCKNLGATGQQVLGAVELVREIARQLDLSRPGGGDEFGFLAKAETW